MRCIYHVNNQFKPWKTNTLVGSIVIVGTLTCCTLLNSVCGLKVAKMNLQSSLVWKLVLDKFELNYKPAKTTKDICFVKGEGVVDYSTVNACFRTFISGCDDQAGLARPRTMDSKTKFQATETNSESTRRVLHRTVRWGLVSDVTTYCKAFDTLNKYYSQK